MPADRPSKLVLLASLFISAAVLLSTLFVLLAGTISLGGRAMSPFLGGFELVILVASVFGVLFGLGKFMRGPAMALLCVAGTIGFCSYLGKISAGGFLEGFEQMYLGVRGLAALVLLGLAAWTVLSRQPSVALPRLLRGLAFAAGLMLLIGGMWALRGTISGLGPMITALAWLLAGTVAIGLLAAATHAIVRAFETGRLSDGGERP